MAESGDAPNRVLLTVGVILASTMISIDMTIANIALPHMQGSVSASQDQMAWVLTSYMVATAVMTPLTGWLSHRIGRKAIYIYSIAGFTIASMLCGAATSLGEIVAFRVLQGLCGAAVSPLSQATLLDTFPPEKIGQAMSIWGMSTMLAPIAGPTVGGWLTDSLSWRWVFFINLPVGLLALAAILVFMGREHDRQRARPFDFMGYGTLVLFIVGLQLALDRGTTLDWFNSPEILTETVLACVGLYLFAVQTITAKYPFFDRALAADRNFISCNVFSFFIGILMFSTMALQPPMVQGLLGYSVFGAGLLMIPGGFGSFTAMFLVGRLVSRVDPRLLIVTGLSLSSFALYQMSHFDLTMGATPFMAAMVCQGFGTGLIFVPLNVMTFSTIDPALRADGTTMYTLTRSIGSSIGVAWMEAFHTRQNAVAHADLAASIQSNNSVVTHGLPAYMNPLSLPGLQSLNGEITRQADMVAYLDVYRLMMIVTLAVIPLLLFIRKGRTIAHGASA
jgi:DHA2 family multidrug resistance protein